MSFAMNHRGKNAATALLLALLVSSCAAQPEKPVTEGKYGRVGECASIGVMAKRLIADYGLAYLADAIDDTATVRMWYVRRKEDDRYGDWAEIAVSNDLEACIVRKGTDWHFAIGR